MDKRRPAQLWFEPRIERTEYSLECVEDQIREKKAEARRRQVHERELDIYPLYEQRQGLQDRIAHLKAGLEHALANDTDEAWQQELDNSE